MKDITGQKFGKLTVLKTSHKDSRGEWHWLCRCDCGNLKTVSGNKLRSGNTISCGCVQRGLRSSGVLRRSHGMTNSRLYVAWRNMKSRCGNPKNIEFNSYGGRGISICEAWKNSFEAFSDWALSHGYAENLTLDRIDVNGNYCPENCQWITDKEQRLNTRRSHSVTAFGVTKTIKEWSDWSGLGYDTIRNRLVYSGWSPEDAVSAPVQRKKKKGYIEK